MFDFKRFGDSLGVVEKLSALKFLCLALKFIGRGIVPEAFVLWREAPEGDVPEYLRQGFLFPHGGTKDDFLSKTVIPCVPFAMGCVEISVKFITVVVGIYVS